jgi:hypothetical protein
MISRKSARALVAFVAVATVGTLVLAEEVTVERNKVNILKGKSSLSLPPLTTASKGDKLTVIDHEGPWLKVQVGDQQGYVLASSLKGHDTGGGGDITKGLTGDANASSAAAGKGLIGDYSQAHGYSQDGLHKMEATIDRLSATPGVLEKFQADGKVGAQ